MKPPLDRQTVAALTAELDGPADPRDADGWLRLLRTLHAIGRRDLPLGRLFEGHVDALQIIARYGSPGQADAAWTAARAGAVFGMWNADLPGDQAALTGDRLSGGKSFASGAGIVSHGLVTADVAGGRQLALVDLVLHPPSIDAGWWRVTGMQRSATHLVRWTDRPAEIELIGNPGDYVREPWFSGGALRFAAVQAGGIAALLDGTRAHLVEQGRAADPHQAGRLADLYGVAAAASAAVARAAGAWHADRIERTIAEVAAARTAVYRAGEEALTLAQAAVGVQAMFTEHPLAERLADLSVYLRQPAPDVQRMRTGAAVAAGILSPEL